MSSLRKYLKLHLNHLNRYKEEFRMYCEYAGKTTKVYRVSPNETPSSEIIFISKYSRNEKFQTKAVSTTFVTFLTGLRKALTYYLTEDGPFNGTSQRVYKRKNRSSLISSSTSIQINEAEFGKEIWRETKAQYRKGLKVQPADCDIMAGKTHLVEMRVKIRTDMNGQPDLFVDVDVTIIIDKVYELCRKYRHGWQSL